MNRWLLGAFLASVLFASAVKPVEAQTLPSVDPSVMCSVLDGAGSLVYQMYQGVLGLRPVKMPLRKGKNYRVEMTHDGRQREYIFHVPKNFKRSAKQKLIFQFHGSPSRGDAEMALIQLYAEAERKGNSYVVVVPFGTAALGSSESCWEGEAARDVVFAFNHDPNLGATYAAGVDDVSFVRAIVDDLERYMEVDRNAIFAAGMSGGGFMSYRLACEAADLFAAIAPVAGVENLMNCEPSRPIGVLQFHGTEDQNAPYNGRVCVDDAGNPCGLCPGFDDVTGECLWQDSARHSFEAFGSHNGCTAGPTVVQELDRRNDGTSVTVEEYSGCDDGVEVKFVTINGGGHAWPGSLVRQRGGIFPWLRTFIWAAVEPLLGEATSEIIANREIVEFFNRHQR